MNSALLGRNVQVRTNDFMFIDLAARITFCSEHDRKFLLELNAPITYDGVTYTHLVASPRLVRDNLNELLNKGALGCAVTWVPKERFDHKKPLDLTWWRGGAAAVTDVVLD